MVDRDAERRFYVFKVLAVGIFSLLVARLWYLQIVRGDAYAALSEGNRIRLISVPAPRGQIVDRDSKALAGSRMAFSVSIIPTGLSAAQEDEVVGRLSSILRLDAAQVKARVHSPGRRPFEPVRVKTDVTPQEVTAVEERRLDLPGVIVEQVPVRNYVAARETSHLLGYIGEVDPSELAAYREEGYRAGAIVGKTGLEKQYETLLHGKEGGQQVEVNNLSRPIRVLGSKNPDPGATLTLTIDRDIQAVAARALSEQLQRLQANPKTKRARAGCVIALDPRNGEIIAMASEPSYDPNSFVGGVSSDTWKLLTERQALANRAVSGLYPPGSTFKVVTAVAALEEGRVGLSDRFFCTGREPVYGKLCWILEKGRGHGSLNLISGIENSCNVVFYELGRRTGITALAKWSRRFGLGEPTGLVYHPAEKRGLVPDADWKQRNFSGYDKKWYESETLDVSIGQGPITVTPLQLTCVYAALANGGTLYQPRLVRSVTRPDGTVVDSSKPSVMGQVGFSKRTRDIVTQGLVAVMKSGTGAGAFRGFPIPVAGKTGTAQNPPNPAHGWFACFAPADNPEIVVLVLIEHGTSGSLAAAPVARRVLEAYFHVPASPLGPAAGPAPAPSTPAAAPAAAPTTEPAAAPTTTSPAPAPAAGPSPAAAPAVAEPPEAGNIQGP